MAEYINLNDSDEESIDNIKVTIKETIILPSEDNGPLFSQEVSRKTEKPSETSNEFDIENQNETLDISTFTPFEIDLINRIKKLHEEEESQYSCDISKYYGDVNPDGSFKRDNLFSELTSEYQRAAARFNLGIADDYSMVWGNLSGNIFNQVDLIQFLKTQTTIPDLNEPYLYGVSLDDLNESKSKNFTMNCLENEYAFLQLPIDDARIAVENIVGGFEKIGMNLINGSYYYTYKSVNKGLGLLHINILNNGN